MKSTIIKRSVVIDGHKTSISLEDAFWNCLKEIAKGRSSAIRLFVLGYYQDQYNRELALAAAASIPH
jgi:predicted DNA-binding ribbon-helix-helix protein